MFVIKKVGTNLYVAKVRFSRSSYTAYLTVARKFSTKEEAERNRCVDNEVIVDLERLLDVVRQ